MLVIVNDSGSHWGTGSLIFLHRLTFVWISVEANTGPQMPPNGVLSRLRSFGGYCSFWEAYRSSQRLPKGCSNLKMILSGLELRLGAFGDLW